jgi:hypothetical protein
LRPISPRPATWWSRLAVDRLIWDKLQTLVDPDYRKSWRRIEKQTEKDLLLAQRRDPADASARARHGVRAITFAIFLQTGYGAFSGKGEAR